MVPGEPKLKQIEELISLIKSAADAGAETGITAASYQDDLLKIHS